MCPRVYFTLLLLILLVKLGGIYDRNVLLDGGWFALRVRVEVML